jgi:hypothetical protein
VTAVVAAQVLTLSVSHGDTFERSFGKQRIFAATQLERGDHITIPLSQHADHHGIYLGDGRVAERASQGVVISTLAEFAAHDPAQRKPSFFTPRESLERVTLYRRDDKPTVYDKAEIAKRAESRIGEPGYDLWTNNCEHFAEWAKNGVAVSWQVETLRYVLQPLRLFFQK